MRDDGGEQIVVDEQPHEMVLNYQSGEDSEGGERSK
jgi:hypothetical protein